MDTSNSQHKDQPPSLPSSPKDLMKRVKFRMGREEDYKDVIALIPNLNDGFDYLPALYHKYIRDPFRWAAITELDGKIAACALAHLIDDGQTLIGNAGRVDPNLQGKGIWKITKQAPIVRDDVSLDKVRYLVFATRNWEEFKAMNRRGAQAALQQTRNLFRVHVSPDAPPLQMKPRSNPCLLTRSLSKPEVMAAMEDVENRWRLFPQGKIVFSWDPYRLLRSNLERINDAACLWVATKDVSDSGAGAGEGACRSLSVASSYFIPRGTRYDISYYNDDCYNNANDDSYSVTDNTDSTADSNNSTSSSSDKSTTNPMTDSRATNSSSFSSSSHNSTTNSTSDKSTTNSTSSSVADDLHNHLALHLSHAQHLSVHGGVHVYLFVPARIQYGTVARVVAELPGLSLRPETIKMHFTEQPYIANVSKL